ncbi:MAG: hypothetical protein P8123_04670 [bacterium]|jgi:hypothetical protein
MTNTKPLLYLFLLLALVIVIVRASSVGRQGMAWLEEIDGSITPLVLEEILGAPETETPGPIPSASCEKMGMAKMTPAAIEASSKTEPQRGDGIAPARIGDVRPSGVLFGVMRDGPPLLAYDAYLSLRELRGGEGQPLSLEEFERGRATVVDEYAAWSGSLTSRSK